MFGLSTSSLSCDRGVVRSHAGVSCAAAAAAAAAFGLSSAAIAASPSPVTPSASAAGLKILVNAGDQGEQSRTATMLIWRGAVEQVLRKERYGDFTVLDTKEMAGDLGSTRARVPDVVVGPAHLIGAALRYGYVPVAGVDMRSQAVLVTLSDSAISTFKHSKGAHLGLPQQDSLVTYLLRGETVAANTTIQRHFKDVYTSRYQDALLVCLQMKRCDVVGVERATVDRWLSVGTKVKVIFQTQTAPGMGIAIRDVAKLMPDALRADLAETMQSQPATVANAAPAPKVVRVEAGDYAYVSTLGYFTPRALAGATVVDAQTVASMLAVHRARYIDTRNDLEYNAGHVPGATLIPYVEKSTKEPDYDASVDNFDIASLGADKNAPLIFGCNGPECWKSHKASIAAIKAGYASVYWFRGGVPEWRQAGMKIETGAGAAASVAAAQ